MARRAIFLSAGVPDPARDLRFYRTADTVAIRAAIVGLIRATMRDFHIVWGGQPGIAPMFEAAARSIPNSSQSWTTLYLSEFFAPQFPEAVQAFQDRIIVPRVDGGREENLAEMRRRMLSGHDFQAAIFIGGMEGIWDEFRLLAASQPDVPTFPIASTGGAAREIFQQGNFPAELETETAYFSLFKALLARPS